MGITVPSSYCQLLERKHLSIRFESTREPRDDDDENKTGKLHHRRTLNTSAHIGLSGGHGAFIVKYVDRLLWRRQWMRWVYVFAATTNRVRKLFVWLLPNSNCDADLLLSFLSWRMIKDHDPIWARTGQYFGHSLLMFGVKSASIQSRINTMLMARNNIKRCLCGLRSATERHQTHFECRLWLSRSLSRTHSTIFANEKSVWNVNSHFRQR